MRLQFRFTCLLIVTMFVIASCKDKKGEKSFEVSGTITNSKAKMIYLEEVPAATMQPFIVDSATLGADGRYKLKAKPAEATIYNLRLDKNTYPVASVVNDASKITLDAAFNDANKQFAEKYEVKGSDASQHIKEFMVSFNEGLQKIFAISQRGDSLQKAKAADSIMMPLVQEHEGVAMSLKSSFTSAIEKSTNPAATMFILGYYQTTANNAGFGLPGLAYEEVKKIVDDAVAKSPGHNGVTAIKNLLDRQQQEQEQQSQSSSWVGKAAPEIVLPDVNGKEIKLSSFKGKYVLVDFWASWCGPCRQENPNVVMAYNKFKNKNFNILGVSFDKPGQKDKWIKAIMDDGLTWTQVSDLQHWNSPVVGLYGIEGIPFNVLVDPEGKVIAEGLRGAGLDRKLEEVLK